jgi:hypothetical protein
MAFHAEVANSDIVVPRRRLALTTGRTREEHQVWRDSAWATRMFSDNGVECLVGLAEEQVVGRVRHERLVTHIAGDKASGIRGRSAFGVKALDKASLG